MSHAGDYEPPIKKFATVNEYKSMNKKLLQSDISAQENQKYDKATYDDLQYVK